MKYLKKFNSINEGYINPISDYLTDFIDSYDFDIEVTEVGVCDLTLKSGGENKMEILGMYQAAIDRMKDDTEEFEILHRKSQEQLRKIYKDEKD